MAVLNFDKSRLGNLEYALRREMLSTDRTGGYMSTTIVACNTRKYHGLVVAPIDSTDEGYVLLSSLDETVVQHDQSFNLALHRYPGIYEPRGHKYITDFEYTPTPTFTFRVGGAVLRKEMLWVHSRTQLLIRYTLLEAHSPTRLRLRPFLAFRNRHTLSKANMEACGSSSPIPGGVRCRLYEGFPWLCMQSDRPETEFVAAPDWYYNFEYAEEAARGYPAHEDLLTPGYFEAPIRVGEPLILSCSVEEMASGEEIDRVFQQELARRSDKSEMLGCLRHAARQFLVRRGDKAEVVAGYPWFGRWGRDTFIALPGITLEQGDVEGCCAVLDTMVGQMKEGLFPNMGTAYNSVDAPLWFFWTLQQLSPYMGGHALWERYGGAMRAILEAYRRGIDGRIALHPNGLIWAAAPGEALTWMDAVVDGVPVTARAGYPVEVNALWYNAVCWSLELARAEGDASFVRAWEPLPEKTRRAFRERFWLEEGYLADYADDSGPDRFIRPNQIVACSLDYRMIDREQMLSVVRTVRQHLLTEKGLRTLSPRNPLYEGHYGGDQPARDRQYHQGTVWVWPLEHYVRAQFLLEGERFIDEAREIYERFREDMIDAGIGSVSEVYDGDPPHAPGGAVSQAWSVGAVLRIGEMIRLHEERRTAGPAERTVRPARVQEAKAKKAATDASEPGNAGRPKAGKQMKNRKR